MDFVAFDLETTGTMADVHQIVEIGAIRYKGYESDAIYSTLVDPRCPMPEDATQVNGITDAMLKGKPFIENLLESFTDFCGDLPLVAHNAPFDIQFLKTDIIKHQIPGPRGVILDTLPMARKIFPRLANYKLATLVRHLNIPSNQFHRAEEDASYCGSLFIEMIKKLSQSGGQIPIETLVALTDRPEYRFPKIKKKEKQLDLGLL